MNARRECSDTDFDEAMGMWRGIKAGDIDMAQVPTPLLEIIQSKALADIARLRGVGGSYAIGLRAATELVAKRVSHELEKREEAQ